VMDADAALRFARFARHTQTAVSVPKACRPAVDDTDLALVVTRLSAALAGIVAYIFAADRRAQCAGCIQLPGLPASAGGRTVMLGLRPRLTVVSAVNVLISGTGKGHCRLKPRMSSRSSVPLVVQICPGKLQKSVTTPGATAGADARAAAGAPAAAPGAGARGERGGRRGGRRGRQVGVLRAPLHAHARLVGAAPARCARRRIAPPWVATLRHPRRWRVCSCIASCIAAS